MWKGAYLRESFWISKVHAMLSIDDDEEKNFAVS